MTTITEDYVSFETAKLLKKKGFDEYCWQLYEYQEVTGKPILLNGWDLDSESDYWNNKYLELYKQEHSYIDYNCSAPTLQKAMKWLRETHDIDFDINTTGSRHVRRYHLAIWENKDEEMVTINPIGYFNKWEQACEAAIKYCLENLI